jgi:hypothetical protein
VRLPPVRLFLERGSVDVDLLELLGRSSPAVAGRPGSPPGRARGMATRSACLSRLVGPVCGAAAQRDRRVVGLARLESLPQRVPARASCPGGPAVIHAELRFGHQVLMVYDGPQSGLADWVSAWVTRYVQTVEPTLRDRATFLHGFSLSVAEGISFESPDRART